MKEQSMGRILRRIRIEQGMTQEALVEGICTAGYLSRVARFRPDRSISY